MYMLYIRKHRAELCRNNRRCACKQFLTSRVAGDIIDKMSRPSAIPRMDFDTTLAQKRQHRFVRCGDITQYPRTYAQLGIRQSGIHNNPAALINLYPVVNHAVDRSRTDNSDLSHLRSPLAQSANKPR